MITNTATPTATHAAMTTLMTDTQALPAMLKLTTWLSPGFPVGGFSYSHGLEQVVAQGDIRDAGETEGWIGDILRHGAGRTDAVFLAEAWRAAADRDKARLGAVAELASAFFPCAERRLEAMAQGRAFGHVCADVWDTGWIGDRPMPHAVAVGAYAGAHGAGLSATAALYLQCFAANLVFAAIRLVPLGQTEGQQIVAGLHPVIMAVAADAIAADPDDLGGSTFLADIAAMDHETLQPRLFRS